MSIILVLLFFFGLCVLGSFRRTCERERIVAILLCKNAPEHNTGATKRSTIVTEIKKMLWAIFIVLCFIAGSLMVK